MKCADAISFQCIKIAKNTGANKADEDNDNNNPDEIKVKVVINTTNLLDSHKDVHIPGLWHKSLKENKLIMHLQEHQMKFDKIISDGDDLKAYTKTYTWEKLGYEFEGDTEALVFESTIKRARNPYMFDQYQKGYVRNHSVGMRYIKLILCINDEDYGAEHDAWEKYYSQIVNKEDADNSGFFWAVRDAQVIEGSAVPKGSNWATPTLSVSSKNEPPVGTQEQYTEPPAGTHKGINYDFLIENLKN
ncbi:hypothetical protein [Sunxiuqinia indica]|uniref:hypothetical protein n=1 Tax=Sunxiuqinia indica TaxID=2692584 RepID=UPI00135C9646|nr:hypothetical protein [Sunxiuqinia indica]